VNLSIFQKVNNPITHLNKFLSMIIEL